ncbi:MAG: HigA family addiction module antitoxin [Candidatus Binatus sp.]|uniref:HigA family addiction module antitoxin n=1 Tax=Candidatus Binatus sp. TaxID=2811406 RepID=UPI003BB09BFA
MITERAVKVGMERRPTHPGAILREDVLPALGFSVSEAARQLGVTRQTLHRIMAEKVSITPEMAARLGRFCGNGPGIWLRMQQACDLWRAERELRAELARIPVHRTSSAA